MLAASVVLAIAILAAYGARREIARQALTGWLESRGVEAELSFERFDHDGLIGRLRAGPAANPDLVVDRIEVDYGVDWWWAPGGWALNPTRIRLVHPVVRGRLVDGKLSLGSLDPLIEDFLGRPPRPDARGPLVLVERGEFRLATDAGPVRVLGDARIDDGRLVRLNAAMPRATLREGDLVAQVAGARLTASSTADRLKLRLSADIESLASDTVELGKTAVLVDADGPYPDFSTKRGDGAVSLRATLTSDALEAGDAGLRDATMSATFEGRSAGWIEDFRLSGPATVTAGAAGAETQGAVLAGANLEAAARELRLARTPQGIRWSFDGSGRLAASSLSQGAARVSAPRLTFTRLSAADAGKGLRVDFAASATAAQLRQGDLDLRGLRGDFTGDADLGAARLVAAGGVLAAGGSWPVLGRAAASDEPSIAGLKRALSDFRLSAPDLRLIIDDGLTITAGAPVRLTPASGGAAVLTPRSGRPLFRSDAGGAFDLAVSGGALPRIQVSVSDYGFAEGGLRADAALKADFDFGFVQGGEINVAGVLRTGAGGGRFSASRCAVIAADRLDFGENDVTTVSGRFCPAGAPLLRFGDGGWRADGRAEGVDATVPFLQIAFDDVSGRVSASGAGGGSMTANVNGGSARDLAEATRFHPLALSGRATLARGDWAGEFRLTDGSYRVADLSLRHDGDAGEGGLLIDARGLTFTEGGLQPAGLSPLAQGFVGDAVEGAADFTGEVRWSEAGASSSGRVSTTGLDFRSPLGQVTGLRTEIDLTSLAPLASAPGQVVTVETIQSYVPLTDARVAFHLAAEALTIEDGQFEVAGGRALFEPLTVPFEAGNTWEGAVRLEGVQLGEFIEKSPFRERVSLDARVSGRLPFSVGPPGVRIAGGELAAIQPGRLSIKREALVDDGAVGGEAEAEAALDGGVAAPVAGFNAQDFAYQALEHLAFDVLEAEVNSLAGGRLGVLLRVRGRHDPPERQEIRLSWTDVLARRFLDKPLPLPSDTGVNLTLDTTWNLDELLQSLRSVEAARETLQEARSEPVQAPGR